MGRHTFLFYGSEESIKHYMTLVSLLESAKNLGLNTVEYCDSLVRAVMIGRKEGEALAAYLQGVYKP